MSTENTRRGFDFNRPTMIALLYLGSIIIQVSFVIAAVMAMIWRSQPHEPWEESHFDFHIRTFLMLAGAAVLLVVATISVVMVAKVHILLPLLIVGGTVLPLLLVWLLVRLVRSLTAAQRREALPPHKIWLFR